MVYGTGLENQRVKAPQVRILSFPPEYSNARQEPDSNLRCESCPFRHFLLKTS